MEFVMLFYLDQSAFDRMTPEEGQKLQDDCKREDEELEQEGKLVLARALQETAKAVTVTVRGSTMTRTDGPYAETKEHLGGIVVVKADTMEEALGMVKSSALAQYGKVEVRPAYDIRASD